MVSRYYAVKELLENNVNALPVTTEQIEAIIINKGFKIINYNVSSKKHAEILENLGVLQIAGRTKAFTHINKNEKFVFVKIGVSASEKRLLLAHELGHIAMRHIPNGSVLGYKPGGLIDEGQEDEANDFALEFLAPVCILSQKHINILQEISALTLLDEKHCRFVADEIRRHKKLTEHEIELCKQFKASDKPKKLHNYKIVCAVIALLISIITLFSFYTVINHSDNVPVNTYEQSVATVSPTEPEHSDLVAITVSGKKYHRPDCRYVKNKTNITEISKSEAEKLGYEACSVCNP